MKTDLTQGNLVKKLSFFFKPGAAVAGMTVLA